MCDVCITSTHCSAMSSLYFALLRHTAVRCPVELSAAHKSPRVFPLFMSTRKSEQNTPTCHAMFMTRVLKKKKREREMLTLYSGSRCWAFKKNFWLLFRSSIQLCHNREQAEKSHVFALCFNQALFKSLGSRVQNR